MVHSIPKYLLKGMFQDHADCPKKNIPTKCQLRLDSYILSCDWYQFHGCHFSHISFRGLLHTTKKCLELMAILVRSRYVKQWVCHTWQWGSRLDFKESPLLNMASKSTFTDINPSNGVALSKDRNGFTKLILS